MEPIDKEQEKKRLKKRSIFNYITYKKIIIVGSAIAFFSLLIFYWALDASLPYAHTMVFTTLTLFQWTVTWLFRSLNKKPYTLGYTTNRWLLVMTVAVLCSHLMALYFQPLRKLLHFTPLTITDWLICLIFPSIFFILSQRKNWFLINDLKEETL
jgi:magnesium-transporting ATPase (P-type)